jgi:putative multiple sugar transport system ATP-binding protein
MKVLSGVYPPAAMTARSSMKAGAAVPRHFRQRRLGIIIIHQELALVPLLSIAENIFLGNETARNGIIDWFEAFARTRELLARSASANHPNTLITNIGVGKQQLVEIAKALNKKVQAADPRRADRQPQRKGFRGAARTC